jgi:hypothetical protein
MQTPAFSCVMPPRATTGILTDAAASASAPTPSGGNGDVFERGGKIGASMARLIAQVNSVRARCDYYVGAIVDQHTTRSFDGANALHQCGKLARYEFGLANLHEIDPFANPALDVLEPRRGILRGRAVCDQIADHSGS